MARRKSTDTLRRQSSDGQRTGENVKTPKKRKVSDVRTPLLDRSPAPNINVTAERGSSVSFVNLSSSKIKGDLSNTHTAASLDDVKRIQRSIQQKICYNTRRSSTGSSTATGPCTQTTREHKKPRRRLMSSPEFVPTANKENCMTVEMTRSAADHQKVTVKGQVVKESTGDGLTNHQYKLKDTTGAITLLSTDKKLKNGGYYILTGLSVMSQKILAVTNSTIITPISPVKGMRTPSTEVISGRIISAKVSVQHFCVSCRTELPTSLDNDYVKCKDTRCGHHVVYSEMPRSAKAEVTLRTDETPDSVFVLSHTHLGNVVPLGETGVLDTTDIERQLLEISDICLTVQGKEVISVNDTPR